MHSNPINCLRGSRWPTGSLQMWLGSHCCMPHTAYSTELWIAALFRSLTLLLQSFYYSDGTRLSWTKSSGFCLWHSRWGCLGNCLVRCVWQIVVFALSCFLHSLRLPSEPAEIGEPECVSPNAQFGTCRQRFALLKIWRLFKQTKAGLPRLLRGAWKLTMGFLVQLTEISLAKPVLTNLFSVSMTRSCMSATPILLDMSSTSSLNCSCRSKRWSNSTSNEIRPLFTKDRQPIQRWSKIR